MNVNQALYLLYSSPEPWITYTQSIDLTNPFLDSAYNNHITNITPDLIQIMIPEQIHMIYNIHSSWIPVDPISKENFHYQTKENPICLRFKRPDISQACVIEFRATIFKNSVRSRLQSKL